jgi:hypothetical protein
MSKTEIMTIERFRVASFEKKCEWVIKNTTYLTSNEVGTNKMYLYHTGYFFIEVSYSTQLKRVDYIQAFNTIEKLMPYSENISLEELIR